MSLLTPLALALAVVAGPIVLMYVLKLRRQPQVVSSTFLWRRALDDVQANAPWQRLRPNLLLLLQLLALAALILALARPAYSRTEAFNGDVVLIVDQSYGMQAHDVAPSRFAVALQRAHALVSQLGSGNVMSVIGMGGQPHLEIAESSDQSAINHAIDRLQSDAGGAGSGSVGPNFLGALSLAASLARSGQSTHVVVLTSRDSGIATLPIPVSFPVDIIRIGRQLHDLGITAFTVKRGPSSTQAVLRVSNFGQRTASSDLDLWVDGQLADVRPLTIAGGQQQNLFWTDLPLTAHQLRARLTHRDDVTSDKSAWAVLPTPITRRVLLVSSGNFFLQTALSLDSSVQLATVQPAAYQPAMAQRFDAIIYDGTLPPVPPPGTALPPTLLVNPPAGRLGPLQFGALSPASTLTETPAAGSGPLTPLLQYVDLSDVHVAQSRAASLPGWLTPLVTTAGRPLIAAGDNGSQRLALIDFDLDHSDWPLRISFPIALQNLLRYLAPGLTLNANTLDAGQPVRFFPAPGTRDLAVTRPHGGPAGAGAPVELHGLGPAGGAPFPPFTDTTQPGLYQVSESGGATRATVSFAVNFFPARPAPAPGPADLHLGHTQGHTGLHTSVPVSFAWAFGLLGLAFLSLEWWVAFRSRL